MATLIEGVVPVVGKPIATIIRTPGYILRPLLWATVLLVIYPSFAFVAAIFVVAHLHDPPRQWILRLADQAFEIDSRMTKKAEDAVATERSDINGNNKVLDGSTLMQFEVSRDNWAEDSYVETLAPDQPASFSTFQNSRLFPVRGVKTADTCTLVDLEIAAGKDGYVGDLLISGVSFSYNKSIPVHYSHRQIANFYTFDASAWKDIKDRAMRADGTLAPIDLLIQFNPAPALGDSNRGPKFPCSRYGVFIVTTYNKRPVP